MASNQKFVDFITDQIRGAGDIVAKKMFGEYGIYSDGKIFGLICDNKLFIKPTPSGRKFIGKAVEGSSLPGSKTQFPDRRKNRRRRMAERIGPDFLKRTA
jgi:TfoX/Sxy family transcriptional regulator of competence genes